MGLPKRVYLQGTHVEVQELYEFHLDAEEGALGLLTNVLEGPDWTIAILAGQGHDTQRDTFLHEVLHLLVKRAGLRLRHEDEERVVSALTPLLLAFLRENREAVEYLQEVKS